MIVKLKNDYISVSLNTKGGKMISAEKNGREYLWSGNPDYWDDIAPVLFPFCGRCRNGRFTYKGREYSMGIHGFLHSSEADSTSGSENKAEFVFLSNSDTLAVYPFEFRTVVSYSLDKSEIIIRICVECLSEEIYYSVGLHPGFSAFGKKRIEFADYCKPYALDIIPGKGLLRPERKEFSRKEIKGFEIDDFAISKCGLFLENADKELTLYDGEKPIVRMKFDPFPVLGFWKAPDADFVCIEPWAGLPALADVDTELESKPGIIKLNKSEIAEYVCTLELL